MDLALSNLACEFTSILSFYSSNSNLTPLSFASRARVQFTFDHAWADSTLSKYRGVVAQFQSFCDAENIPVISAFPPVKIFYAVSRPHGSALLQALR